MFFGKFSRLVGQYCNYLLPKKALPTLKEKRNKIGRTMSGHGYAVQFVMGTKFINMSFLSYAPTRKTHSSRAKRRTLRYVLR